MRHKYEIDETLFNEINSDWKAYFLGWLWSDGNLKKNTIKISLSSKDCEVLSFFNHKIFNNKRKIYIQKPRPFISTNGKEYTSCEMYSFVISNANITKSLKTIGLNENKSFDIVFPKIPKELKSAFLRGVFEGDGWAHFNPFKHDKEIGIGCGSRIFIQEISNLLNELNIQHSVRDKEKFSSIRISSFEAIQSFYSYVYNGAEFKLQRKHDKILEILNYNQNRLNSFSSVEKGICFHKQKQKWMLRIDGKFIGYFNEQSAAIKKKYELS